VKEECNEFQMFL